VLSIVYVSTNKMPNSHMRGFWGMDDNQAIQTALHKGAEPLYPYVQSHF